MSDDRQNGVSIQSPGTGRFLLGFVLVPGAIVLICLAIAVGVRWLTFPGTDPESLVDTIERREGNARWRAAVQLAGMLADPNRAELRQDRRLAQRLTAILRQELETGGGRREDVTLRVFLCRALGEFETAASLPVLLDAAERPHTDDVRRSAIEAIAVLGDALGPGRLRTEPGAVDTLLAASRDGDPQVRLSAAFALGVIGGPEAEPRLARILLDENALVRYNAATGLARWGNRAALPVLLEMLAPDQQVKSVRQELIQVNALEAIGQLCQANPSISLEAVRPALDRLQAATESAPVREKIDEVRKVLESTSD